MDYDELLLRLSNYGPTGSYDSERAEAWHAITKLRAELDALAAQNEILQNDCFNLTEKVIPNLREQRDALRALLQKLRGSVRLYRGGGVAGQQMGNESYSILVTGHTLGDIDAALAGDKP